MLQHFTAPVAFIFFVVGALLMFEIFRPFHDLRIDGPIAMVCWILGVIVAGFGMWFYRSHMGWHAIALGLNLLGSIAILALFVLLGGNKKLF